TAIGVLYESVERHDALTPLGATLRSDVPGSMRAWALLVFSDDQGRAWEVLTHSVRTGAHAYRHMFGTDIWTRLAARPDGARLLLIERVLPERIDPNDAATQERFIADIQMFVNPGGRERTEAEFRDLLTRSGLRLTGIVNTTAPQAVMEVDLA